MTRQGKHHTVRSDLTGLTLLIITTKQSVTFYGKMYGKVQYRTPIPSHVPVKVNTVTCAGKGFVTPNKHDELPHSFYSTTDNNNYQQWNFLLFSASEISSSGISFYFQLLKIAVVEFPTIFVIKFFSGMSLPRKINGNSSFY